MEVKYEEEEDTEHYVRYPTRDIKSDQDYSHHKE